MSRNGVPASIPIADLAPIGDCRTVALVARDGTIPWWCIPGFDGDACFTSLLGTPANGGWQIRTAEPVIATERRYRPGTAILETTLRTAAGALVVTDVMPRGRGRPAIVRVLEAREGSVTLETRVAPRFAYGSVRPVARAIDGGMTFTAGGDALVLRSPLALARDGADGVTAVRLAPGGRTWFTLAWYPADEEPAPAFDPDAALTATERVWTAWSARGAYQGGDADRVSRSLITLKILTDERSGGTVAAGTTSLPEQPGGAKNWDYRYAWLRDSAFTISALVRGGYLEEARGWRDWLLRVIAGSPERLQIMYTVGGGRRIDEWEAPWLPGWGGARPVRIGNAAFKQFQLGVYGHVLDAVVRAHEAGITIDPSAWEILRNVVATVEQQRNLPDQGMWESRGRPRHYTVSRVLAWLAFDRAARMGEELGEREHVARWRRLAHEMHAQIVERAWRPRLRAFAATYETDDLDASLLLMPIVGFLPADDERVAGTIAAIERDLTVDGFVRRTTADPQTGRSDAGETEATFFACGFWLVQCYALAGRADDARALFDRLVGASNDVGILSEEYAARTRRQLGNTPQTFSHATLVSAAFSLETGRSDATLGRAGRIPV